MQIEICLMSDKEKLYRKYECFGTISQLREIGYTRKVIEASNNTSILPKIMGDLFQLDLSRMQNRKLISI